jgi:hypothetical protein
VIGRKPLTSTDAVGLPNKCVYTSWHVGLAPGFRFRFRYVLHPFAAKHSHWMSLQHLPVDFSCTSLWRPAKHRRSLGRHEGFVES